MKCFVVIGFICCLSCTHSQAQTPRSQAFVFAGAPAAGFDFSARISRKKWSSEVLSIAASPTFYFRRFNFSFDPGRSKFTHYRVMMPVTLRLDFYINQLMLPDIGKKKLKVGVFLDAGYIASYTVKADLHEEFYFGSNKSSPDFVFDGNIVSKSEKLSFHPTIGFGMRMGRVTMLFRAVMRPYQWRDLSKDWELPKGETSYFYSWEYSQTGAMICLGYRL